MDRPKNRKLRNRRKLVEQKVDHGRPQWSLNTIARKNRKSVHNSRTPEGGGGGRAKRSSIIMLARVNLKVLKTFILDTFAAENKIKPMDFQLFVFFAVSYNKH